MLPEPGDAEVVDDAPVRRLPGPATDPQSLSLSIAVAYANMVLDRSTRRIIKRIQTHHASNILGDDRRLQNLWDEFCAEMQIGPTIYRPEFECQMRDFVSWHLKELPPLDQWSIFHLADDEPPAEWVSVSSEHIESDRMTDYVSNEVLSRALNWESKRIRSYVDDHTYSTS